MAGSTHDKVPLWSSAVPIAAAAVLALKYLHVIPGDTTLVLAVSALLLAGSVFAAVHHAEVLAVRLGEPFGSILLAVAVTVIEVALIVSILVSDKPGSAEVARDTVFSAVMIVLNGVVGLCLVLGAHRHREQTVRIEASAASLPVLGTLAVFALMMPNFTESTRGPVYAPVQLMVIGAVSLALYLTYVFVQTVRHRDYFLDIVPPRDDMEIHPIDRPSTQTAIASLLLLLVSLTAVILLAKLLSVPIGAAILAAGLPTAFLGVVIAAVVLMPEGLASIKAALANRLQNAMNLALGSAVASIGLTIPTVAVVSLMLDLPLVLGLSDEDMVLLMLTLFVSTLTLGTGRTTVLHGAVHLVIFAVFLLLSAVP